MLFFKNYDDASYDGGDVDDGNKADDNHGDPGSHDDKNASVDGRNPAQVDR